jgi:uncharacterized protein (DUF1800 family)
MGHKRHRTGWALAGCAWMCVAAASTPRDLAHDDVAWLNRITYGVNSSTVARYRIEGRRRFLQEQLTSTPTLPAAVAEQIQNLEISHVDGATLLREVSNEQKRINSLPEGEPRETARKALNEHGNQLANEAARREILRAIYSSSQLQEQLTWFWLNHFSVHQAKANGRWLVADYTERAIRPYALGHFSDLVMATLQHPMMLQYLDNAQNAKGHINENYARELLELHTLGVGSGYTQQDVQELARVLTGVGIQDGDFEFDPKRHDSGDKTLLGQRIQGTGFDEVRNAVELIVSQPACARFVSRKLAMYFVADDPPPHLIEQMSRTFTKTHGDIRAVLETMLASKDFTHSFGTKFRDPMQYVIASVRLAYDDKPIESVRPIMNWLNALGEPLYGRATPDGYPLTANAWTSSGQMSRRFEIARAIGSGNAGLFQPEGGAVATRTGFPQIATRVYYDSIEPQLAADTRAALDKASSQAEWNTFLLASPDLNYH